MVNHNHEYWRLNNADSNELKINKKWKHALRGVQHTLTSLPGERIIAWSMNEDGRSSGLRCAGRYLAVQITCDGSDSVVQYKYADAPDIDRFVLVGTVLDASRFAATDSVKMSRVKINIDPAPWWELIPFAEIVCGAGVLVLGFAAGFYCGRRGKRDAAQQEPSCSSSPSTSSCV